MTLARKPASERSFKRSNELIWWAALALHALAFGIKLLQTARGRDMGFGMTQYTVSEWLVSYAGGFVRRGLAGSALREVATVTHVPAHGIVYAFGGLLTVGVVALFASALWRERGRVSPLAFATLAFSPLLIPYQILNFDAMGRKELAFVLLLSLHLALAARAVRARRAGETDTYVRQATILLLLLGTMAMLLHESFLFLGLPINVALSAALLTGPPRNRLAALLAIYGPTLAIALLVLLKRGDIGVAQAIERDWRVAGEGPDYVDMTSNHAMYWLSATTADGLALGRRTMTHFGPQLLAIYGIALSALVWALRLVRGAERTKGLFDPFERRYLLMPLLASLPLYVIATDWGRWLTTTAASFFLISVWSDRLFGAPATDVGPLAVRPKAALAFCVVIAPFLHIIPSWGGYSRTVSNGLAQVALAVVGRKP